MITWPARAGSVAAQIRPFSCDLWYSNNVWQFLEQNSSLRMVKFQKQAKVKPIDADVCPGSSQAAATFVLRAGACRATGLGTSSLTFFSFSSSGSDSSWVTESISVVAIWSGVPSLGRWAALCLSSSISKSDLLAVDWLRESAPFYHLLGIVSSLLESQYCRTRLASKCSLIITIIR